MHTVLENDKDALDKGSMLKDAINYGVNMFTPDLIFENLVKDYSMAEKLYGPTLIRVISGYDPSYIERNINIPEFQRELKKQIKQGIEALKKEDLLNKDGELTEQATELASLSLYIEELDNITPKGSFGERIHKKTYIYGAKAEDRNYKKGDRYKDLALKKSVKLAIRRNRKELRTEDLRVYERESKGLTYIIYGMDISGSMRGKKINMSKKAGVALAYKAIDNKDKVGLVIFNDEVRDDISPTIDFSKILKTITTARASKETNIVQCLKKAIELFPGEDVTKHLILLTDALPTKGKQPEKETLEHVATANAHGITVSLIGINLDKRGKELAKRIIEIGQGRLYVVNNIEELDKVVLEEYMEVA